MQHLTRGRRALILSVLTLSALATVAATASPVSATGGAPGSAPRQFFPPGSEVQVDGQLGVAYVPRGGTHTFTVGDMVDLPSLGNDYIRAHNPDPDFYNWNGWYTINTFVVFPNADCSGQPVRSIYTGNMQPRTASATTTFSGAVRTYSVQAWQALYMDWLEASIDLVDAVDEDLTNPVQLRSNCVTVRMNVDYVQLLGNGSTDATTVTEGTGIGLATTQPTGDTWTQQLIETDSACVTGTIIASGAQGSTVSTTIDRPPGDHWFIVRAVSGTDEIWTNCVRVTVESIPATLKVAGRSDWTDFVSGQTLPLYVTDFSPGARTAGLVYPGSTTCSGPSRALTSGDATPEGTIDTSARFDFATDVSVRFIALGATNSVGEATNCVILYHHDTDIELTVNGSRGPVLVDGGEIHFIATGLPPDSTAYAVLGCDGPFVPDDFGQPIGPDGTFDGYMSEDLPDEFTLRVAIEPTSPISSNCVLVHLVQYLIDPSIVVNGSPAPDPVEVGSPFEVVGQAFPPDRTASVRTFEGASCTGPSTVAGAETDAEGNLSLTTTAGAAGVTSIQVDIDEWVSNCVPLTIDPLPPVDPPDPVVPDGPIVLRANDMTTPQSVASGTQVELSAENLGVAQPFDLRWYPAADCSGAARSLGSGTGGDGLVGATRRNTAGPAGFQLQSGMRTSNCVAVEWLPVASPEPLAIHLPADITRANDPGRADAVVTWPEITTTGGIAPVTVTCTSSSGDVFPLGVTTVACSATDSAPQQQVRSDDPPRLSAGASFTVTVTDVEPPAIAGLPDLAVSIAAAPVAVDFPLPHATDNSGAAPTVACAPSSGSSFAAGVHLVTCTATDSAGNQAASTFSVTVTVDGAAVPTVPTAGTTPTSPGGPLQMPPAPTQLPATGGSPTNLLAAGAALVVLGCVLALASARVRRRRLAEP